MKTEYYSANGITAKGGAAAPSFLNIPDCILFGGIAKSIMRITHHPEKKGGSR